MEKKKKVEIIKLKKCVSIHPVFALRISRKSPILKVISGLLTAKFM